MDPQHKEELHGYLQIVDDDVTPEMNGNEGDVDDDDYDDDDEEESVNASFDEASDSNSEDDDDKVECDADCEVDEEFRKDIKMALGDAAVSSNEVCSLIYYNRIIEYNIASKKRKIKNCSIFIPY